MKALNEPPTVYTVEEFVSKFKMSRAALYRLWAEGTGPRRMRIGRSIRITAQAANDWIKERESHAD